MRRRLNHARKARCGGDKAGDTHRIPRVAVVETGLGDVREDRRVVAQGELATKRAHDTLGGQHP